MFRTKHGQQAGANGRSAEQEIVEGLRPVCICKGIRQGAVLKQIRSGKRTLEEVRRETGAGSGSCKGERCTPRIEELLRREQGGKQRGS